MKNENSKLEVPKAKNNKTDTKKADTKKTLLKEESIDPATYANNNKIAYDPRNTCALCKICEKKFPSTLHGMKEHIQGRDHISKTKPAMTKSAPKKTKLEKIPMDQFVTSMYTMVFGSSSDMDVVINETVCISSKSINAITMTLSGIAEYKCQICSVNVYWDMIEHCKTEKHLKGVTQICVITNLKNEFVREVRPDEFHCGFCNILVRGWYATKEHLRTTAHRDCAAACARRLHYHLPVIAHDQQVQAGFIQMFLTHIMQN